MPGMSIHVVDIARGAVAVGMLVRVERLAREGRILVAQGLIAVFLHIALNTFWLSLTLGKGYLALLPARALKNLIQYAIDVPMLYFLLRFLKRQFRKA